MKGLFSQVVSHPVAVSMIFLAALVFGYVSYQRLPVELMPDISYPTITVRTVYEGAAPQEVEAQISRPVEESLATLDGLVTLESRSRADQSDVVLGFDWGTDMAGAVQTIRENLQTTWLPDEADRPLILRYDPSLDPFVRVALAIDPDNPPEGIDPETQRGREKALFLLREWADTTIKRELEGMKGVAAARVRGGLEREIRVEVREDWLAARALPLESVRSALSSENINVAGGSIIEGDTEYLVRTLNEYTTLRELKDLRIRRDDGVLVPLTDVAEVFETHREREVISRLNGQEAVEIEIFKEADANVVEVANRVKLRLLGDPNAPTKEQIEAVRKAKGDKAAAAMKVEPSITEGLPDGVVLALLDDQAAFIESAIANLRDTALFGGVLAIGVLFLFLRDFRTTGIIGLSIPISVVIGFAPLYLLGVSLNLMSLGGLALGVGMLVDNAVVVLESIYRYREEGLERTEAAVAGVSDVATAVTASTLTTVAVFVPIAFVEGVGGELFGDLSLAVVSSLVASLAVALFMVPTMAAIELPEVSLDAESVGQPQTALQWAAASLPLRQRALGLWKLAWDPPRQEWGAWWAWRKERIWRWAWVPWALTRFLLSVLTGLVLVVSAVVVSLLSRVFFGIAAMFLRPVAGVLMAVAGWFQLGYGRVAKRYTGALGWSLQHGGTLLGVAAVLFVVALAGARTLGSELVPEMHQGRFTVDTRMPVGTPLDHTAARSAEVERLVASHTEVQSVYASVGVDRRADSAGDEGPHTSKLRVQLVPGGDAAQKEARVMDDLRRELAGYERLEAKMSRPALFSFRTPVEVVLFGWDLDRLRVNADAVTKRLAAIPGLRDVRSSLSRGHPEVRIRYDRTRLHRVGLDANTVAQRVRDKVQGVRATEIHQGDRRVELRVQLMEDDRGSLGDLRQINVNPALVPAIPLDAVADFEEAVGPSEIRRIDQQRAVVIGANLEGFDLGSAGGDIEAAMVGAQLPEDIRWSTAGQSEEMNESLASLQLALMLAVFLVYVIMASTFESLVHPFIILFSVPLALVGTVVALAIWGLPISVVVFIGGIVLAGVVVNNAIVLVDTINRLHADGHGNPVAQAARLRLRPILITTATTVLGLLPLSLGFGDGSEVQQPLAVAVIGGLMSSTLLTLVVIPVLYDQVHKRRSSSALPEGEGAPAK